MISDIWLIAGDGIVHGSVEEEEYIEAMNNMGSNLATINNMNDKIYEQQQEHPIWTR